MGPILSLYDVRQSIRLSVDCVYLLNVSKLFTDVKKIRENIPTLELRTFINRPSADASPEHTVASDGVPIFSYRFLPLPKAADERRWPDIGSNEGKPKLTYYYGPDYNYEGFPEVWSHAHPCCVIWRCYVSA